MKRCSQRHCLSFLTLSFKPGSSLASFTLKRLVSSPSLCHRGGVLWISDVVGVSAHNSDSSFLLIQPGISHDTPCTWAKEAGGSKQPCQTPSLILNHSLFPRPVLPVASLPAYRFLRRQVWWSGTCSSLRIFHSSLWSTQSKGLVQPMKQK